MSMTPELSDGLKTSVPAALGEARFLPGVEIAPKTPSPLAALVKPGAGRPS